MAMYDIILPGEKFIYDWQYGRLNEFHRYLIQAMLYADINNLSKLGKGFPEEVAAYRKFTSEDGWWENLKMRVEGNVE